MHVLVLGAGLAGLACAHELARAGVRVTVLERARHVGGMAHSWRKDEFWLDHGPHRFHTRDAALAAHVDDVLDGEVLTRERRSRIHLQGRYFDYPLRMSNVVRNLPAGLLARAALDYAAVRIKERIAPTDDLHFESWVTKRFGRTLYEVFFGTYTSKAWGMPCTQISADWAAQRIAQANLVDAVRRALFPPKDGLVRGLVDRFTYPTHGGIGALGRAYARKLVVAGGEIVLGARVTRLVRSDGVVRSVRFRRDGVEHGVTCDAVVNTTPLPEIARALDPRCEPDVRDAARSLRHIGIVFVYLELARPRLSDDHWIYLPERHLRTHRVSEFKNFSPHAAPHDRSAVCCEITCRPGDATWTLDLAQAAELATRDLEACGLARAHELRPLDLARLTHAYPVYDLEYKPRVDRLRAALRDVANLFTTGRQGLFRYNNMDHSLAMGRRTAQQVIAQKTAARAVAEQQECAPEPHAPLPLARTAAEEVAAAQEYFG